MLGFLSLKQQNNIFNVVILKSYEYLNEQQGAVIFVKLTKYE